MDTRTALQVPGFRVARCAGVTSQAGDFAWSQVATGNGSVEGGAEIADGPGRSPRGSSTVCIALATW